MFKLKSLNKKGFGHVEMIVFAVVVLAIGGIGYFALNSSSAMSEAERWHCDHHAGSISSPIINKSAQHTTYTYTLRYVFDYNVDNVVIHWGDGTSLPRNTNTSLSYPGGVTKTYTTRAQRKITIDVHCTGTNGGQLFHKWIYNVWSQTTP